MRYVIAFLLVVVSVAVAAESEAPKSPLVAKAQRALEAQQRLAKAQLDRAMKEAQDEYMAQLKTALDAALENKDLEEANRIDAAMKSFKLQSVGAEGPDKAKSLPSLVGTTWTQREWPCKMTLKADGELDSHTNPNPAVRGKGTWVVIDEGRVRMSFPGFQSQVFTFDGKTLKAEAMTWDLTAKAQSEEPKERKSADAGETPEQTAARLRARIGELERKGKRDDDRTMKAKAAAEKPTWQWTVDARKIEIDTKTKGRVTVNGDSSRFTATSTTTDLNSLEAFGQFTNLSKASYDYTFTIVIYRKTSFPVKNPPILGSKVVRTGLLKPGQSTAIAVDVPVSSVLGSWNVRIENISAAE